MSLVWLLLILVPVALAEECADLEEHCKAWAEIGECDANLITMKHYCALTCGHCEEGGKLECTDEHTSCREWASYGECDNNPGYMLISCKRACQVCECHDCPTEEPLPDNNGGDNGGDNDSGNGEGAGDGNPDEPQANCEDQHEKCATWADANECALNPTWMLDNCALSCKLCPENPDECHDSQRGCEHWATLGECLKNPGWMPQNCKKSCHNCDGTMDMDKHCIDKHTECKQWASEHECANNAGWMPYNCPLSCNLKECIPDHQNKCLDASSACEYWAGNGECYANPGYMLSSCPVACGTCDGGSGNSKCVDRHAECPKWAEGDGCATRSNMFTECALSCELCPPEDSQGETCRNANKACQYWADHRECRINPTWMLKNCPIACNTCDDAPGLDDSDKCTNLPAYATDCTEWGIRECASNSVWMGIMCPETCDVLDCREDVPAGSCQDDHAGCKWWSGNGECYSNAGWMPIHCPVSCGFCDGEEGGASECVDRQEMCADWKQGNQCAANPGYMLENCAKSCEVCPPKDYDGECRDASYGCKSWGETGECDSNPSWMLKNCPVSCHSCDGIHEVIPGTCEGRCGEHGLQGDCSCDALCDKHGDCCADLQDICPAVTPGECEDKERGCEQFAANGECERIPEFMHENCAKSCGKC